MELQLEGKKVLIIGERDGVPGPAIVKCIEAAKGHVLYSYTDCFV